MGTARYNNRGGEGYELTNTAGKPLVDDEGHYHLPLDGALVDMFITPDTKLSMQNVAPGKHELAVIPAINDRRARHHPRLTALSGCLTALGHNTVDTS